MEKEEKLNFDLPLGESKKEEAPKEEVVIKKKPTPKKVKKQPQKQPPTQAPKAEKPEPKTQESLPLLKEKTNLTPGQIIAHRLIHKAKKRGN